MNSYFAETYQTVSDNLLKCEEPIMNIIEAIKSSPCIVKEQKKPLLEKVQRLFKDSNDILNDLGKLGKVK